MVVIHEVCIHCSHVHSCRKDRELATAFKGFTRYVAIFAAAGHNNYTKCCRLYLQDAQKLCSCLSGFTEGPFAVRRNAQLFWSGTWSDMVIEQCLMRAGKTAGGLINITHKEAVKTVWLSAAHIIAQYSDGLRQLTDTYTGTWSHQHREIKPTRVKKDSEDMQKMLSFLQTHNPFTPTTDNVLVNIATGVVASDQVNVDEALIVGRKIHDSITNKTFSQVSLKRKKQAVTFAVAKKALRIDSGVKLHISSSELSQRLLAVASCSQQQILLFIHISCQQLLQRCSLTTD